MRYILFCFLVFTCSPALANERQQRDTLPPADGTISRVEASFIGGDISWRNFIEQNIDPTVPGKNKAPAGTYLVQVEFYIDTTGKVTGIKALTRHGYGMEAEVIRLLKKSPKWSVARENGRPVRAYRKQPVTFKVQK